MASTAGMRSPRRRSTTSRVIEAPVPYVLATAPTTNFSWTFTEYCSTLCTFYNKYGSPISYDEWTHLSQLTDWVVDNWRRTDEGVWEVRGGQQHFVYSKLMCWVALDRAIRLADKRSFPADRERWLAARDENLSRHHGEGMERGAPGIRAALRRPLP